MAGDGLSECIKDFGQMKRIRNIGEGAHGSVALVEDHLIHELIAFKTFNQTPTADQNISDTFFREVWRFFKFVKIGRNHFGSVSLVISGFEVFGSFIE
jgi:hypothetical protein